MAEVACTILNFDGVDDEVSVADNAAYDVTAAISFHMWLRRDYDDGPCVLAYRASTISIEIDANDRLKVTVSGVTAVTFHRGFQKETWHAFGVVVYESGVALNFQLFYNGVLDEEQSVAASAMPAAAATAFYIGNDHTTNWFDGRMTNFVSTSDQLTAAEIATIYASGMLIQDVADYDADMICFPFNEGTGTSLDNDGLAGVDGTLAGTPVWLNGPGASLQFNPMTLKDQNDQFHDDIIVDHFEWYAPTTTSHLAQVTDWNGYDLFRADCSVAVAEVVGGTIDRMVHGLKVPDLDSGWILVFWK